MTRHRDPVIDGLDVYRVGGAVRDTRLGWPVYDQDWVVVGATPEEMLSRGFKAVGRDFPVFLHPRTHEEYALARTERKQGHGYTGFVVHASPDVSLEEDLARRDLTINAMAETPEGELVDPFKGLVDLEARILRHVSPAFVEDPLRVLRTARFLARYQGLGFTIADETRRLMRHLAHSGEIGHLVAERVWQETEKALGEPHPDAYFRTLAECDALRVLMPMLADDADALETALTRMIQIPEDVEPRPWRWARLCEHLPEAELEALHDALRIPNAYREQARLLARTRQLRLAVSGAELDASTAMEWFNRVDAWRRSERVVPLVELLNYDDPGLARDVMLAWRLASQVVPKVLVAEGYKGAELGRELARRRHEAMLAALNVP
ncbi:fused tRNA nucleotidyltransferase/2',3'-cyclic phosphodiesterase/2' nucleotidase/phosphatase Cca [Halomonas shantousis]